MQCQGSSMFPKTPPTDYQNIVFQEIGQPLKAVQYNNQLQIAEKAVQHNQEIQIIVVVVVAVEDTVAAVVDAVVVQAVFAAVDVESSLVAGGMSSLQNHQSVAY